jgi:hypothetical protein
MNGRAWLKRVAPAVFVAVAAAGAAGCSGTFGIQVDDENGYWKKAAVDEELAGNWFLGDEDGFIRFTKRDGHYEVSLPGGGGEEAAEEDTEPWQAKTLRVGRHRFLLFRAPVPVTGTPEVDEAQAEVKSVILCRYDVTKTGLRFYWPDQEALLKAAEDDRWKGVIRSEEMKLVHLGDPEVVHPGDPGEKERKTHTVPVIPQLNERTLAFLEWFSDHPKNWDTDDFELLLTRTPPEKKETTP